ncbi:MAG: DUF2975 domain-containing protein [Balneolaceae bacterium]|nr:MAG: DUF2975 domain-containing protein [Balneolaceae bacterium]
MKATGRWSVISLIRFFVQFVWTVVFALVVISGAALIISLVTGSPLLPMGLPVYFSPHSIITDIRDQLEPGSVVLHSFSGIKARYYSLEEITPLSLLLGFFQVILAGYTLFLLTILKRPLNAMALDRVFEIENGKELKKVALLLLFAAPLKYGYEWLSKISFEESTGLLEGMIMAPPFDFILLMAGLICYIIAEIVNQAAIIHQEHTLTV